ncbi:MAG: hypothetical protein U0Y96_07915 [Candidatus Kapaibacterium sp.]
MKHSLYILLLVLLVSCSAPSVSIKHQIQSVANHSPSETFSMVERFLKEHGFKIDFSEYKSSEVDAKSTGKIKASGFVNPLLKLKVDGFDGKPFYNCEADKDKTVETITCRVDIQINNIKDSDKTALILVLSDGSPTESFTMDKCKSTGKLEKYIFTMLK